MATVEVKAPLPSGDAPINIVDLANLIATTSRLLIGLAGLPQFKNAQVSLAEWLALSVLADTSGVSNKALARSLGVTGQRANQLCTSLAKANLISVDQAESDGRRNIIKVTDGGKKRLGDLNTQLQELVSGALKDRERSVVTAGKQMRLMMRIVQAGNPEQAVKRAQKKERKQAAAT